MKGDFTRDTFRADKNYSSVRMQQGRPMLDADWNEQVDILNNRIEVLTKDTIGFTGGMPSIASPASVLAVSPEVNLDVDALIQPGRYYVGGLVVEIKDPVRFTQQPFSPGATWPRLLTGPDIKKEYTVIIEAWQRHVTALEDPTLSEAALGGADSCTRTQVVWQMRVVEVENFDFLKSVINARGLMEARCVADQSTLAAMENRLYRVEIVKGGSLGEAQFAWSRDNATTVARWLRGNGPIVVSRPLRSETQGFEPGQWLELTDEDRELRREMGKFVKISTVTQRGSELELQLSENVTFPDRARNPRVRAWTGNAQQTTYPVPLKPAAPDGFINLENGISIRFAEKDPNARHFANPTAVLSPSQQICHYRVGDYWLIPARALLGGIDWPANAPQQAPRAVGLRDFASVGSLTVDLATTPRTVTLPSRTAREALKPFEPLSELTKKVADLQQQLSDALAQLNRNIARTFIDNISLEFMATFPGGFTPAPPPRDPRTNLPRSFRDNAEVIVRYPQPFASRPTLNVGIIHLKPGTFPTTSANVPYYSLGITDLAENGVFVGFRFNITLTFPCSLEMIIFRWVATGV